jgi:hypothetical protein
MLDKNQALLQQLHWQSDALTTRLVSENAGYVPRTVATGGLQRDVVYLG